ncbi:MAG TPA: glycosyltransferase family 2 protein [Planctomycetaceae bacterium]|nr:glycosyltransferase family 2 protein [Planctomycetaceae bacterium]
MLTLQVGFWLCVGIIFYSYLIYPMMLAVAVRLHPPQTSAPETCEIPVENWPLISLIIAAYCEENVILQRLHNALMLDYPADRIEILIGVDGDLDATGEIVASIPDDRIRLLQFPVRRGKASVLNDCFAAATGEILLFSDANTFWDKDAAKQLVRHFTKNSIGGVCGRLILTDADGGTNCDGLYWRYENQLKEWEGQLGALLGANGAIYGIRKNLYQPIPTQTIIDDFLIGMRIHQQGSRFLYEPNAIAREETAPTISDEFKRRSRIGAGGFQSLAWLSSLLLPHYGLVSWAFWSHKVLRWICPAAMLVALVSNWFLAVTPPYQALLLLQSGFYLAALCGAMSILPGPLGKLSRVLWMFVNMNAALASGFWKWLSQSQSATWKRTDRSETEAESKPEFVASVK